MNECIFEKVIAELEGRDLSTMPLEEIEKVVRIYNKVERGIEARKLLAQYRSNLEKNANGDASEYGFNGLSAWTLACGIAGCC